MTDRARRHFLQTSLATLAAATAAQGAESENPTMAATLSKSAFAHDHVPQPLPFDPTTLRGLSERLLVSHWENNYGGAVKALNAVRRKLGALGSDEPPYLYNDLKREHLIRTGSVVLHELYFANLGGDGKAPAETRSVLARVFGSFDAWQSEFVRIGQGLGGGSGWVVLGFNEHLELLENYWLADHGSNPPYTRPVLVMDMYEHAYHMDYGAAAAKYIDAFFANIRWDAIAERMSASKV
jgi:Fe-Mn family superoxide dismutase